jgi:hypothetical protein
LPDRSSGFAKRQQSRYGMGFRCNETNAPVRPTESYEGLQNHDIASYF